MSFLTALIFCLNNIDESESQSCSFTQAFLCPHSSFLWSVGQSFDTLTGRMCCRDFCLSPSSRQLYFLSVKIWWQSIQQVMVSEGGWEKCTPGDTVLVLPPHQHTLLNLHRPCTLTCLTLYTENTKWFRTLTCYSDTTWWEQPPHVNQATLF